MARDVSVYVFMGLFARASRHTLRELDNAVVFTSGREDIRTRVSSLGSFVLRRSNRYRFDGEDMGKGKYFPSL